MCEVCLSLPKVLGLGPASLGLWEELGSVYEMMFLLYAGELSRIKPRTLYFFLLNCVIIFRLIGGKSYLSPVSPDL